MLNNFDRQPNRTGSRAMPWWWLILIGLTVLVMGMDALQFSTLARLVMLLILAAVAVIAVGVFLAMAANQGMVFRPKPFTIEPINRLGRFHRFADESRWHLFWPGFESRGQPIYLGPRRQWVSVAGPRSEDGLPFQLRVWVTYTVDPRRFPSEFWALAAELPAKLWNEWIQVDVQHAARAAIDAFDHRALLRDAAERKLEARLGAQVAAMVERLAMKMDPEGGLRVFDLNLMPAVQDVHLAPKLAGARGQATAEQLRPLHTLVDETGRSAREVLELAAATTMVDQPGAAGVLPWMLMERPERPSSGAGTPSRVGTPGGSHSNPAA